MRQSRSSGRPPRGVAWCGHWLSKAKYSSLTLATATGRPFTSTVVVSPGEIQSVGMASTYGTAITGSGSPSSREATDPESLLDRATHDQGLVFCRQALNDLCIGQGISHALRVREVRAEHEMVGRQPDVDQPFRVRLVKGVDPDVALEDLERILVEEDR